MLLPLGREPAKWVKTKQKPRPKKSFQFPRDLGALRAYNVGGITPQGFPKKPFQRGTSLSTVSSELRNLDPGL